NQGVSLRLVPRGPLLPHRPRGRIPARGRIRGRGSLAAATVWRPAGPQAVAMRPELGKFIVGAGAFLILAGLVVWSGGLSWFGRLPGDVRVERETVRIYVPIVSMLLVSVVLSLIFYLFRRFL